MKLVICRKCQQEKTHEAKGLCRSCYETERQKLRGKRLKLVVCGDCKLNKPHHAKGLCTTCYGNSIYTLEQRNAKAKRYYKNNKQKAIEREMTKRNYTRDKCKNCGSTDELEFHHLLDEQGQYNRDNFIVLCKPCHLLETRSKSLLKIKQ